MATIRDVAKEAGVSIATVSNYINASVPVSFSTAARIKQAIEKLDYIPSSTAKTLRSSACKEIGVLLPNLSDPYYVQIFQGIENALRGSGYYINLSFSYDDPELEARNARDLRSRQSSGLIIVSCRPEQWRFYYDNFTSQKRPIVMIDRMIHGLDANYVSFDNHQVIQSLTSQFLAQGEHSIYLFTGPKAFTCENDCVRGFCDAFSKQGLSVSPSQIIETTLTKENAFTRAIQLFKSVRPHCILTSSELCAAGVTEARGLLHISPQEVRVLSLGEQHWNRFTQTSSIFTTERPAIRLGNVAASLLLGQIISPLRESEHILLQDACLESEHSPTNNQPSGLSVFTPPLQLRLLLLDTPAVRNFQGLAQNFTAQSGVDVRMDFVPDHLILDTILNHGSEYDLIMFDIPWLPSLAVSGRLRDISTYMSTYRNTHFFSDCLRHFGLYRGKVYGLPFLYASQVLYYREDLFENTALQVAFEQQYGIRLRPPLTMKEFAAMAEFFTSSTDAVDYGISISAAYPECFAPEIHFRLNSFGSQIYDSAGNATFDNPQTLKTYIHLCRCVHAAKPNFIQANDETIIQDFLSGETAMLITYPALLPDSFNQQHASSSFGYSMVPGRTPLLGGWSLGISSACRHSEAAEAFLSWVSDETISNYFTVMGGQTAVSSTYANDEMISLYPWLTLYQKAYYYARMPQQPQQADGRIIPYEHLNQIICKHAYDVILGDLDIQQALSRTQEELQAYLHTY